MTTVLGQTREVSWIQLARGWWQATRPRTWGPTFAPILVASAWLWAELRAQGDIFEPQVSAWALGSTLLLQIGTNLFNDALDFCKGADTGTRIGPMRLSQRGWVAWKTVWWAGCLAFAFAVLFGIPLVQRGGGVIVVIGLLSGLAGYAYTGGPYPLAYRGLGDFFVLLFFGWIAVLGLFFVHLAPHHHFPASYWQDGWVLGTQVGLLATVLIAINHFRDEPTDRQVGKNTLSVRWGRQWGRFEILSCAFLPYILNLFWLASPDPGKKAAALSSGLLFPFSLGSYWPFLTHRWKTLRGAALNSLLARSSLLQFMWSLLWSAGLISASLWVSPHK